MLVLWRCWRFTLKPMIQPSDAPKEVPYWIPFLGHTLQFFQSSDKLLEYGLNYVNRTHEIFSVLVGGQKMHIVTDPTDVKAVFADSEAMGFDAHLARLIQYFGVTAAGCVKAWYKPQPGDKCYDTPTNPDNLKFIHWSEATYRKQLLPGVHQDNLCKAFMDSGCCSFQGDCTLFNKELPGESRLMSLQSLCRIVIVEAVTQSFWGNHLHNLDPDIVSDLLEFNDNVWMVAYGISDSFFGRRVAPVKKKLRNIMDQFLKSNPTDHPERGELAFIISQMIQSMENVDLDDESRSSLCLMIFWAAISNEYNAAFWLITEMLHDQELLDAIITETEAAWFPTGPDGALELNTKHLAMRSPNMDSLFNEMLRSRNGATALRHLTRDTVVGGKMLKKGDNVVVPFKQLHTNEKVWGPTVSEFNPKRFKEKKTLARHPSFRPWGGGASQCVGKHVAKEEVFGFIAVLFHRFDVKLAPQHSGEPAQPFPRINDTIPSLGINGPMKGEDTIIELRVKA
ncbi:cytochrome P450 [Cladorrhinum sp. PSN259]|nr:cytochrome P450 [Cladorrhinum sp. PSN259]